MILGFLTIGKRFFMAVIQPILLATLLATNHSQLLRWNQDMKLTTVLMAISLLIGSHATAQDNDTKDNEFIKSTIDLGCVVQDII